jgi:hypothetical protein
VIAAVEKELGSSAVLATASSQPQVNA